MTERVGIVFVSHSVQLAEGVVALAGQMAPSVRFVAAGGTDDGGIGTSFAKVSAAVGDAEAGAGVVVISDLGSALLTAETVLDLLTDEQRAQVAVVDVPFVEGGVAAAVAAESGADLAAVVAAAEDARSAWAEAASSASGAAPASGAAASAGPGGRYVREVVLRNKDGLHARPAAEFVKLANTFGASVTVNGKDAKSLLGIMSLGLTAGTTAEIASSDDDGVPAVDALAALIETGFGEA
ncbi:dihydroxyacetone kinase phosphoryl donor subunit DhaM [Leifsonia sp. PS1209]|uniref:dihydroxyacetone kinase phosphoryl donor subunit DhaM n=1 Tax=Leifsonia sp. PS1209 TaxID=2724914 RepID=UPI001442B271|nr:dihydroxyacetone kinase phosphoryl donor subunit DhaM [Leifsonia sp. PS1209]QIZ99061.1 PTS-dependent dihydroxyacetone kinase phosphotransferase subunit DhaM [Leifsonia sp. PS1209]